MIKTSIIVIQYSYTKKQNILVQFDSTDCFELRICDICIEFKIDTLINHV